MALPQKGTTTRPNIAFILCDNVGWGASKFLLGQSNTTGRQSLFFIELFLLDTLARSGTDRSAGRPAAGRPGPDVTFPVSRKSM
jgi:hypothetical protein